MRKVKALKFVRARYSSGGYAIMCSSTIAEIDWVDGEFKIRGIKLIGIPDTLKNTFKAPEEALKHLREVVIPASINFMLEDVEKEPLMFVTKAYANTKAKLMNMQKGEAMYFPKFVAEEEKETYKVKESGWYVMNLATQEFVEP